MPCHGSAVGNTCVAFRNLHIPSVMFDIPHPRISIFIILYISRAIGDIPLFIPAFPVILAAAGKSFKIPVDPKFFGMGSVYGNNFRLYFYLFSGTSRERRTAAVSMISKGVPLRMTAFAVWLYATWTLSESWRSPSATSFASA